MAGPDRDKAFDFTAYSQGSVKAALDALFHGKCAYCESFYAKTQPVDVEHYRPKGKVEGEGAHPGYWWLAMVWTNLLPSCIDCNRRRGQRAPDADSPSMVRLQENGDFDRSVPLSSGKEAAFPLAAGSFRAAGEDDDCDQEQRLLLDPTRDDPDLHLAFHIDRANLIGLIYPRPLAPGVAPVLPNPAHDVIQLENQAVAAGISAPGAVSIQVYGLNRLALVQARTRVLRDLEFLVDLALGLEEVLAEIADRIAAQTAARAAASTRRRPEIGRELAFLDPRRSPPPPPPRPHPRAPPRQDQRKGPLHRDGEGLGQGVPGGQLANSSPVRGGEERSLSGGQASTGGPTPGGPAKPVEGLAQPVLTVLNSSPSFARGRGTVGRTVEGLFR